MTKFELNFNDETIKQTYERLGFTKGWRFMTCPKERLYDAEFGIIGLQPGGNTHDRINDNWSQELGNAYEVEVWEGRIAGNSPLQLQVKRLCSLLGTSPAQIFSAQFVPFRSPSWAEMQNKGAAIDFANSIWSETLSKAANLRTIFCIGLDEPTSSIARIVNAQQIASSPTGWGDIMYKLFQTNDGRNVVGLPHLSRFRLFGKLERDILFKNTMQKLGIDL